MQKFIEKVQNSKGFVSLDTLITGAILVAVGIAITALFVLKGQGIAGDTSAKLDAAKTANTAVDTSATGK